MKLFKALLAKADRITELEAQLDTLLLRVSRLELQNNFNKVQDALKGNSND